MTKLEKFIKEKLTVDEIRHRTGISPHVVKSQASAELRGFGVKHVEYELLRLIYSIKTGQSGASADTSKNDIAKKLAQQAKTHFDKLSPAEKEIIGKIEQGAEFDDLRKSLGMSKFCLKFRLQMILTKLGVKNIEYTLLCALHNPDEPST